MAGYCILQRFVLCTFALLLLTLTGAAQQPPAGKVIDLTAADGVNIKATYFAGKPGPGVLLLHQCNQARKAWDGLAAQLAAAGLNVLTMDYRGYGESGGKRFNDLTPAENSQMVNQIWPQDTSVAIRYLESQPGVKREVIGLGGASCGVNQAIQVARRHPEVKSLVLLSGSSDREGRLFLQKAAGLPMFMAAADDDGNGGASGIMEWLYGLSANPGNRFIRYPTGGHGNEMFAQRKELPGMIVDWFDTTLVKTPGKAPAGGTHKPSDVAGMLALIDEPGGPAKAAPALEDVRRKDPRAAASLEFTINLIGYEHLQTGDIKGAIEIFRFNVENYPGSANAYDSLGDAYLAGGQNDLALQSSRKAIDLLSSDASLDAQRRNDIRESAEQKIKQLVKHD